MSKGTSSLQSFRITCKQKSILYPKSAWDRSKIKLIEHYKVISTEKNRTKARRNIISISKTQLSQRKVKNITIENWTTAGAHNISPSSFKHLPSKQITQLTTTASLNLNGNISIFSQADLGKAAENVLENKSELQFASLLDTTISQVEDLIEISIKTFNFGVYEEATPQVGFESKTPV